MYGTIFRMQVKAGREDDLVRLFEEWESERKGKVKGALGGLLMKPDNRSGEMMGVAIFEDRASYAANADDAEQHAWFMKIRDLLAADPEWEDGEYVPAACLRPATSRPFCRQNSFGSEKRLRIGSSSRSVEGKFA